MDQGPSELSAVSLTLSAEQLILNDQFAELAGVINGSADVSGIYDVSNLNLPKL